MGNLVCDGTEFSCPFCTSKLKLKVPSSSAKSQGKNLANTGNCFFPPPGGQCTVVPSAPVPCTPAATPVDPRQKPVKIAELPALGAGCKFQCAKGGLLTVSSDGQTKAKHEEASGIGSVVSTGGGASIAATAAGNLFDVKDNNKNSDEDQKKIGDIDENVSSPSGSKRNQHVNPPYQRTRNKRTNVNGRSYSGHALDQMQNRGIPPSVVENTIKKDQTTTRIIEGKTTINYFDKRNNITVVTNNEGGIITVGYGKIGK